MNQEEIQQIKELIDSGYYEGLIFPSGVIYKGGFYQGVTHGKGTIILPNGNTYFYDFRNGKLVDGRAIIVYPDGSFYEGEVSSSNQPYGKAIIRNPDGSTYYQGNWYYKHDPKIIWLCGGFLWYEDGKVFEIQPATPFALSITSQINWLHPAVCLKLPASWEKDKVCPVQVMFPHLQELGCPKSKNYFTLYTWHTTPEKAVKYGGFDDLQDYFEWINDPDIKILKRLLTTVEAAEYGMKVFGLLPQGNEHGQGHNIAHGLTDIALGGVKFLIERQIKKRHNH